MRPKVIVAGALLLAGCASTQPQVVNIPVAKSCALEIAPRPDFPDTKAAVLGAENIQARVELLLAGRIMRDKRIDDLEAALDGCR
jgi:PBP1b-binding outer membrane lipoprotein LpoB